MRVFIAKGLPPRKLGFLRGYAVQITSQVYISVLPSSICRAVLHVLQGSEKGSVLLIEPESGMTIHGFGSMQDALSETDDLVARSLKTKR